MLKLLTLISPINIGIILQVSVNQFLKQKNPLLKDFIILMVIVLD